MRINLLTTILLFALTANLSHADVYFYQEDVQSKSIRVLKTDAGEVAFQKCTNTLNEDTRCVTLGDQISYPESAVREARNSHHLKILLKGLSYAGVTLGAVATSVITVPAAVATTAVTGSIGAIGLTAFGVSHFVFDNLNPFYSMHARDILDHSLSPHERNKNVFFKVKDIEEFEEEMLEVLDSI